jgi:hypothetical protein
MACRLRRRLCAMPTPYTVFFPDDEAVHPADLEHSAPLPRVGDSVEYLDTRGTCRRYVVKDVVHTLQAPPGSRPRVSDQRSVPAAFARGESEPPEIPGDGGELRAGLPKVFLARAEHDAFGTSHEMRGWRVVGVPSGEQGKRDDG